MVKRIVMLCLCLSIVAASFFSKGTYAWFNASVANQKILNIGDLSYEYQGDFIALAVGERVVPDQELLYNSVEDSSDLVVINKSSIDSQLRAQIRYSYTDYLDPLQVYVNQPYFLGAGCPLYNNYLIVSIDPNWIYNSTDECYYYNYGGYDEIIPALPVPVGSGEAFVFSDSIKFKETLTENLSGAQFNVRIIFQAKQANLVNWSTIGYTELNNLATQP